MYHLLLIIICIISVEIFIKLNFFLTLNLFFEVAKKAGKIIMQDKISDHWKEKVIPVYSLRMIKYSVEILLILILIFSLFFLIDYLYSGFLIYIISIFGIIESLFFAFGYFYLRKLLS